MKDNVIVEISVVPIGTADTSISQYVAGCIGVLDACNDIKYQLTPMGTVVEGPLDRVLELVKLMHEVPFKKGISRVITTVKIDDRRDIKASMKGKIDSVLRVNPKIKTGRIK